MKEIRKAVLPVAGLGTRFLPVTKSVPKEMLPIVDKPLIQYAVEEAIEAGIEEFIFVTHPEKSAIEDYFNRSETLERELAASNKMDLLGQLSGLLSADFSYKFIFQHQPLGLGHAVLCAREAVAGEPFAVILPDDLIVNKPGCLSQMTGLFRQNQASNIAVETVPPEQTDRYGIVSTAEGSDTVKTITAIVEKPSPEEAPSTLAVVGRYILTPRIFELLEKTPQGSGGEIQLTDAIAMLLEDETLYACEFDGIRYDCGSRLGYLQANVALALAHPELEEIFSDFLSSIER